MAKRTNQSQSPGADDAPATDQATDQADDQLAATAGEDAAPQAAPITEVQTVPAGERQPRLGNAVRYVPRGGAATCLAIVCRTYNAADLADLAIYPNHQDLEPFVERRVVHSFRSSEGVRSAEGRWYWPDEDLAVKSPGDLLSEAIQKATRIPRPGELISFLVDEGDSLFQRVVARRARIRRVLTPTRIELSVYEELKPPDNPHDLDPFEDRLEWNGRNAAFDRGTENVHNWEYSSTLPVGSRWPEKRRSELLRGRCGKCNEPCRLPMSSIEVNGQTIYACDTCLTGIRGELSKLGAKV